MPHGAEELAKKHNPIITINTVGGDVLDAPGRHMELIALRKDLFM